MKDAQARPYRLPGVHLERTSQADTLCDRTGTPLVRLNETAAALWDLCDGRTTVSEIAEAVRALVGRDEVLGEVIRALDELAAVGVVQLRPVTSCDSSRLG